MRLQLRCPVCDQQLTCYHVEFSRWHVACPCGLAGPYHRDHDEAVRLFRVHVRTEQQPTFPQLKEA